ncbi:MAG: GntR family transcriptional regulator [Anaerolineaceae bacterium]|nr:GntR family transcriptional regulator [Anaerolineaceae bacterium]MBN2677788.1 GntR family transcriptional regulator [Anaerolineaceae bacterium]
MNIQVDFRSTVPIYTQIVEQLRQMIEKGEIKVGDKLPTVREMAADLRVNFNTVARAYRILDESGLISTQLGRGTYIWEPPTEAALKKLHEENLESLTRDYLREAKNLGFKRQDIENEIKTQLMDRDREEPPVD